MRRPYFFTGLQAQSHHRVEPVRLESLAVTALNRRDGGIALGERVIVGIKGRDGGIDTRHHFVRNQIVVTRGEIEIATLLIHDGGATPDRVTGVAFRHGVRFPEQRARRKVQGNNATPKITAKVDDIFLKGRHPSIDHPVMNNGRSRDNRAWVVFHLRCPYEFTVVLSDCHDRCPAKFGDAGLVIPTRLVTEHNDLGINGWGHAGEVARNPRVIGNCHRPNPLPGHGVKPV